MKHLHPLYYFLFSLLFPLAAQSQTTDTSHHATDARPDTARSAVHMKWIATMHDSYETMSAHHVYVTWGGDGPLLSFGSVRENGEHVRNIPRFSFFFNIGNNFNYDFSKHFGVFTGLNLRNMGIITKENDSLKLKRRVYSLAVPIGFKVGEIRHGSIMFFAGGEYALNFNYKEKQFIDGDKRHKFNTWFSDRTPIFQPSVFAGIRIHPGIGLKVQYFLTDLLNKDYHETVGGVKTYPYAQTDSKMFFVTLSYNFARPWHDHPHGSHGHYHKQDNQSFNP